MDCLREFADLVADLPNRPIDDILIGELPKIESVLTELIHNLRAQIDIFVRKRRQLARADDRIALSQHSELNAKDTSSAPRVEPSSSKVEHNAQRLQPSVEPSSQKVEQESKSVVEGNGSQLCASASSTDDTQDQRARIASQSLALARARQTDLVAQRFNNWAVARKKIARDDQLRSAPSPYVRYVSDQVPSFVPRSSRAESHGDSREITVPITDRLSLRAIEINNVSSISRDGVLYYLPQAKRFAMRIAGFTFQGNIGTVFTSLETRPQKVHDCNRLRHCDLSTCSYYHNPQLFVGSTDIRNFVASSWLYKRDTRTTSAHDTSTNTHKSRKVSSRASLDVDILTVSQADLSYYNEQFMHDLLCSLIMNLYVKT